MVLMGVLKVTSPAFPHEEAIPPRNTCDGEDISPPLEWSTGPPGTHSYALVMDDPDAPRGTWVHWIVWNLGATSLPEHVPPDAELTDGARQGLNSWGRTGYGGPCPPGGTHRYYFRVYALDVRSLSLPPRADKAALLRAMEGHTLAHGELMGRYSRRSVR